MKTQLAFAIFIALGLICVSQGRAPDFGGAQAGDDLQGPARHLTAPVVSTKTPVVSTNNDATALTAQLDKQTQMKGLKWKTLAHEHKLCKSSVRWVIKNVNVNVTLHTKLFGANAPKAVAKEVISAKYAVLPDGQYLLVIVVKVEVGNIVNNLRVVIRWTPTPVKDASQENANPDDLQLMGKGMWTGMWTGTLENIDVVDDADENIDVLDDADEDIFS